MFKLCIPAIAMTVDIRLAFFTSTYSTDVTFPSVPTAKKVGVLQLLKGSEESLCASVGVVGWWWWWWGGGGGGGGGCGGVVVVVVGGGGGEEEEENEE